MKTSKKIYIFLISLLIIALFAVPALPIVASPPAAPIEPGELLMEVPLAAPTPISNVVAFPDESRRVRTVYADTAIAADTNTTSFCLGTAFEVADYAVLIDHGTTNTTSVIIEFSNDGTNWDVGPTLVSASAADIYDISKVQLFGACQRFDLDVVNTNTITIGITALPK